MIHVGQANHTGNLNDTIPAMGTQPYCFMQSYTKRVKDAVNIPVNCGFKNAHIIPNAIIIK